MKTIGISGKIGSGKTTCLNMLLTLGFPVFNSDDAAKKSYTKIEIREKIQSICQGINFESPLWKSYLASQIFTNEQLKIQVEAVIHADVQEQFQCWKAQQKSVVCFKESAVISTFTDENTDELWIVEAPKELRFKRVSARSSMSEQDFEERNKIQESLKKSFTGPTLYLNNDDQTPLLPQIEATSIFS